jgi:hypothetical protein
VSNGLYSVLLGDTALPNMTSIPRTVFDHSEVQLRVWFNDGSKGSQLLTPDQRIAAVGYAFMAARVGDSFTGALISTNGSQFNIAAPGGINLTTTGTGSTGVAITTKFDPKGAPALSVPGGILADNVFATKSLIGKNLEVTNTVFADQGQFTGEVRASAFVPSSDRNAKDQFRFVNAREILSRLAAIPIQTWKFKQDSTRTPHIGPMAQDFYAAFQVGSDDKHIATVDADGVAFAAIQGLNEIVQEQNSELTAKTERIDGLEKRLIEIEKRLNQNAK